MSTRRPRIKAVVATLPVRRKPADVRPKLSGTDGDQSQECRHAGESRATAVGVAAGKSTSEHRTTSHAIIGDTTSQTTCEDVTASGTPSGEVTTNQPTSENPTLSPNTSETVTKNITTVITGQTTTSVVTTSQIAAPDVASCLKNVDKNTISQLTVVRSTECSGGDVTKNTSANKHTTRERLKDIREVEVSGVAAGVVDGIVPLAAPTSRAPQLKNEILARSAEVSFDPLVPLAPLPSPSRPRVKLRPAPRLPPHSPRLPPLSPAQLTPRRPSLHGSASESEEDWRRPAALDTGSTHHSAMASSRDNARGTPSSAAPAPAPAATPTTLVSPLRDARPPPTPRRGRGGAGGAGGRGARGVRRTARARAPAPGDRLTMYDLIFYNPTTNPLVQADKPGSDGAVAEEGADECGADEDEAAEDEAAEDAAPAPQIKIGPDGQIVVDEQSLVIKQTARAGRLRAAVVERAGAGGRYTRAPRSRAWTDAETVRFYRALAALGTDFSLMSPLFPDRSRRDLKTKFKKEERSNGAQVEMALSSRGRFSADSLARQFESERRAAEERARAEAAAAADARRRDRERARAARRQGYTLNKAGRAAVELVPATRAGAGLGSAADVVAYEALRPARAPAPAPAAYEVPADASPRALVAAVAPGSLVCLAVPDPARPAARVLQTYVSRGGRLAPVSVSPAMLASLLQYMSPPPAPAASAPAAPATPASPYTVTAL